MLGDPGLALSQRLDQFPHGPFAGAERFEQPPSSRVRNSSEDIHPTSMLSQVYAVTFIQSAARPSLQRAPAAVLTRSAPVTGQFRDGVVEGGSMIAEFGRSTGVPRHPSRRREADR